MDTQCEYVRDVSYLVTDLIDKQYLDELLTCRKIAKWNCNNCQTVWSESITKRKRYDLCPKCEKRVERNNCLICGQVRAIYNFPQYRWGSYCSKDYSLVCENMINVYKDNCKKEKCTKSPSYNYPGEKNGIYCSEHGKKIEGMINVTTPKCLKCDKHSSYGYPGTTKRLYCVTHGKEIEGMINLGSAKCQHCTKQASFNYPGNTRGVCCSVHSKLYPGMIDIQNRSCEEEGCFKHPQYNYPDQKTGTHCWNHQKDGMVDVRGYFCITCKNENVETYATYNLPGVKKPQYCFKHKSEDMIDIKNASKMCVVKDCPQRGSFKENGKYYCANHNSAAMDSIRKKCPCGTIPTFNIPGHIPEYCAKCKKRGMIDKPTKRCENEECKELATHGETSPIHCEDHALPGEVNLLERKCKKCNLDFVLNIDDLCEYCDPFQSKKYRHAKELEVKDFLDSNNIQYESHDRVVEKGVCGKERPDFLFDCGTHFVIVEVDENRHNHVTPECERIRMINISQSLGLPTIFIRYNPDSYRAKGEKKRTSGKSRRLRQLKLKEWKCHF